MEKGPERKKLIVLAFNTACTGQNTTHENGVGEVIALGASVVNEDGHEIDGFSFGCYRPRDKNNQNQFEKRCWDEFWSKNEEKLKFFEFDQNVTVVEQAKKMTLKFQEFRAKWETYARDNNLDYVIVSDNKVYDGEKMNQLIVRFTDDIVLPYSASEYPHPKNKTNESIAMQQYENFEETTSMKRGFLVAYNLGRVNKIKDFSDLEKEFDFPAPENIRTHTPRDDAYSIARDRQLLQGISTGKFKKRTHQDAFDSETDENKKLKIVCDTIC
jgi:hypothetical protein